MSNKNIDESPGFWIYRVHMLGTAALRKALQAKGHDVTPEQLTVMARLFEQEGMNQSQLGEKVLKDRHNMTRILNLLEKKGLIERRPDGNDKRAYRLYLTENGRSVLRKAAPVVRIHWEKRIEGLSQEDLRGLRRILGHMSENLLKSLSKLY